MRHRILGPLAVALVTACGAAPGPRAAAAPAPAALAARTAGTFTRGSLEGFDYEVYLPPSWKRFVPIPLVVMLHGCGQDADEFALVSGMNGVAEREGFAVLYPEQPLSHHHRRCWRWFDPAHQSRDAGEPGAIRGMVTRVQEQYGVDPARVYVAGLSAGGCMASVVVASYPEVFAAASSASGLEYLAATDEMAAWRAMAQGGPDPGPLARRIFSAMGPRPAQLPVMVFHGGTDILVNTRNGEQTAGQWARVNDLVLRAQGKGSLATEPTREESGSVPGGHSYRHAYYEDTSRTALIEHVVVSGMGHAWSGGAPGRSFSDPAGPPASRMIWAFFRNHRK